MKNHFFFAAILVGVVGVCFSAHAWITSPQVLMTTGPGGGGGVPPPTFVFTPVPPYNSGCTAPPVTVCVPDNTAAGTTVATFTQTPDVGTPTVQSCSQSPCPFVLAGSTGAHKVNVASGITLVDANNLLFTVQSNPPVAATYPLKVVGGQLQTVTGTPFFIVGDNGYGIMQWAPATGSGGSNGPNANMTTYFAHLQALGFNASLELNLCDAYLSCNNTGQAFDGTLPFNASLGGCSPAGQIGCWDLSQPNPFYWNQVVNMVNIANQYNILIILGTAQNGTCGTFGGPTMYNNLVNAGATAAFNFGAFLGNTFKNLPNVVWYHGDDYTCWQNTTDDNYVIQVALGIQSTGDTHLHTMEVAFPTPGSSGPGGANQTSLDVTTHNWASVIGINHVYQDGTSYTLANHAYNQASAVPAIMGELDYAGLNITGNNFSNTIPGCSTSGLTASPYCPVRQRAETWWPATFGAYWGALIGRFQNTATFNSFTDPSYIPVVPDTQFIYLAKFMQSIAWYKLVPSPGGTGSIVTGGFGSNADGNPLASTYVTSSISADGKLALIYVPTANPGPITVNMSKMVGTTTAKWYDPTADPTLSASYTTVCSPCGTGSQSFTSPFTHSGDSTRDAVLLLTAQ